jgi:hypothetical protein
VPLERRGRHGHKGDPLPGREPSQAPLAPYTRLWTRLTDFHPHEPVDLMYDWSVVRLFLMCDTIHLVTADDDLDLDRLLKDVHRRILASIQTVSSCVLPSISKASPQPAIGYCPPLH